MAKLNQQSIVITVSELLRDGDEQKVLLSSEMTAQLEAVVEQLVGEGTTGKVVVEIQTA
jgi:hypothetical protein